MASVYALGRKKEKEDSASFAGDGEENQQGKLHSMVLKVN